MMKTRLFCLILSVALMLSCCAFAEGVGDAAAEPALTLVKNENNAFPLQWKPGEKTLIILSGFGGSGAEAGEPAWPQPDGQQALPEGAEIVVMTSTPHNGDVCVLAALGADHVILVHRVYSQACLDPATEEGFSSGTFDRVISALHEKGKAAVVVSVQLPYGAARFPDADAILLAYREGGQELPAEGRPDRLPAGLLACFGLVEVTGTLPVDVPALDASYQPTDTILWPQGHSAAGESSNAPAQESTAEENTAAESTESSRQDMQYVLYLGTNDQYTNKPVFTQAEALEKLKDILIRHFGGYTIQEANGGWIDGGTEYQEYTLVIYLSDTTIDKIHAAADEMVETFRQSSVLIHENPTRTEFYSPAK